MTQHIIPEAEALFEQMASYLSPEEQRCVYEAYELARREHGATCRLDGALFLTHPVTVATYLAEYQADAASLMAALLHDIAEDTIVSIKQIRNQFGDEVAHLVDGLTKFEAVTEGVDAPRLSKEHAQAATLHKLFGVMTDDLRVGIIKLFDRQHNMRTIKATPPESQRRKAEEVVAVYAPLAYRLGMWQLRNELGTLALEILDPDAYFTIRQRLEQLRHQQQVDFAQVSRQILERLSEENMTAHVYPSLENIYTVYDNARSNGSQKFEIDETLRVIVELPDEATCYLALGIIHAMWPPVPHSFDDYIARPRDNLYSALHTMVNHSTGQRVKIRLRTRAMNVLSQIGVLARWVQMGMPLWSKELAERVEDMADRISDNINLEPQDVQAGVQSVVEDVFRKQILVYTPRGDVKQLPQGATPVDFAYAIHTEVGNHCAAAVVNGRRFPLNRALGDGDRVYIDKRESHTPERTWLDEDLGYTTTRYARMNIRRWFRRLPDETAVAEGKALVAKEMGMLGLSDTSHEHIARLLESDDKLALYHDVGRAEIPPTNLATRVLEDNWERIPARPIGRELYTDDGQKVIITRAGERTLRFCRVCRPRPGDDILGFIRADGSVTVHSESCGQLPSDPTAERRLKLGWGEEGASQVRVIKVKIDVYDRPNLLLEIAEFLRDEQINIDTITIDKEESGSKSIVLELEVFTPRQVVRILHQVHALVNVYDVYCLSFQEETRRETP